MKNNLGLAVLMIRRIRKAPTEEKALIIYEKWQELEEEMSRPFPSAHVMKRILTQIGIEENQEKRFITNF